MQSVIATKNGKWVKPLFTHLPTLLEEMERPAWRIGRPLVQMVNDWHSFPDTREKLLNDVPPPDSNPKSLVKVASVLHALCDDNGLDVPDWVHSHKADPEFMLFGFPMVGEFAEMVRNEAPSACAAHGVWFEYSTIRPKGEGLVNPLKDLSPEEFGKLLGLTD